MLLLVSCIPWPSSVPRKPPTPFESNSFQILQLHSLKKLKFHWRKTAAMLTGDWLHSVFTAAILKWMLSTGRQPYCESLPSLPSVQLTHFPHPSNIKHLSPRCPLTWWLGFSFHRENKGNPMKMFFPAHNHLPYGLSLYPHALSFFLLWWVNDRGSSVRLMYLFTGPLPILSLKDFTLATFSLLNGTVDFPSFWIFRTGIQICCHIFLNIFFWSHILP